MNAKERNLLISKNVLMLLIVANILNSIWVIIYDYMEMKRAQEELGDDWYNNEIHQGHYAKYWFIGCLVIMVFGDLVSLFGIYGAYKEDSQIVTLFSIIMFFLAVYGAWDKYSKGSITSFVVPYITGCAGILYSFLNFKSIYEGHSPDVNIKYINKPTTPTEKTYAEAVKLNPDCSEA